MSNPGVAAGKVTSNKTPVIKLHNAQRAIPGENELLSNLGIIRSILIYESSNTRDPILIGQYKKLNLTNYFNTVTNSSRTIATIVTLNGVCVTKNSDRVTKVVGQKNYDVIFHALCSVLSHEAKVKAMLALLTAPTQLTNTCTQTEGSHCERIVKTDDSASQTDVWMPLSVLKPKKANPRYKKVGPHVISKQDSDDSKKPIICPYIKDNSKVRKIVINPADFKVFLNSENKQLPELGNLNTDLDEDCNSNLSDFSLKTVDSSTLRVAESFIDCTEKRTEKEGMSSDESETENDRSESVASPVSVFNPCEYELYDGSKVKLPAKPEDIFHVATKDNLVYLSPHDKKRVVLHQAYVDFTYCLEPNDKGYLPIHLAVLYNDLDMLTRQCLLLPHRGSHVDVFLLKDNLSPLHLAIMKEVSVDIIDKLLEFKADPLDALEEHKNAFHRAAESSKPVYLKMLYKHVAKRPRELMQANDLWTNEMWTWTNTRLLNHLHQCISEKADLEGYTPLMLASKMGRYRNVQVLLSKCSSTVNLGMRTSGNTALFLTVEAAGTEAIERGNKMALPESYLKTIEILLKHNADPLIENFSSTSVTDLLGEFNMNHLSMFIAQKVCSIREIPQTTKIDQFMVIKDEKINEGKMLCAPINGGDTTNTIDLENNKAKPVKLQNSKDLENKEKPVTLQNKKDLENKEKPVTLHNTKDLENKEKPVQLQNTKGLDKKEGKFVMLQNAKDLQNKEKPVILQNTKGLDKKEGKSVILQNTKDQENKEKPVILQNTKGLDKKEGKSVILQNSKDVKNKEKPAILQNTKGLDKKEGKSVLLHNSKDLENKEKPVILQNTKGLDKKEGKSVILQNTKGLDKKVSTPVILQNILIHPAQSPVKNVQTFFDNKKSNSFNICINIPPKKQETSAVDAKTSSKRKNAPIEIFDDKKIKFNIIPKKI